jgi:glucuronosyltransferase
MFDLQYFGHIDSAFMLWFIGESMCHSVLQQDSLQKIIHSTDLHFDVVMVSAFFSECLLGFAHKFQAPIIQVCPYVGGNFMGDWVGSPNPYSYVPDEFIEYTDKMNFWERTHNTIECLLKHVLRQLIHVPKQNAACKNTSTIPTIYRLYGS